MHLSLSSLAYGHLRQPDHHRQYNPRYRCRSHQSFRTRAFCRLSSASGMFPRTQSRSIHAGNAIPTTRYPSTARVTPDSRRILYQWTVSIIQHPLPLLTCEYKSAGCTIRLSLQASCARTTDCRHAHVLWPIERSSHTRSTRHHPDGLHLTTR